MSESETASQTLPQPPSLVLVAPKPRRPIALVARKHHHRHTSSQSHFRSSRTIPSSGTKPTAEEAKDTIERVTSPGSASSTVRMAGHPYPRAKTPSNANANSNVVSPAAAALAGVTAWPLGLGISQVSPPPRSKTSSRESMGSRPLSRLSSKDSATLPSSLTLASAEATNNLASVLDVVDTHNVTDGKTDTDSDQADEPMLASPPLLARAASSDVHRTPTKNKSTAHHNLVSAASHLSARSNLEDDQEPRSTPTIGALSPRQDDSTHCLTLSPTSPTEQRITAAASATAAQLPLPLSSPPAVPAAVAHSVDQLTKESPRRETSASVAPSPCLSQSHSRSPSASPSPCPSPGFGTLLDSHLPPPKHAEEPRKMALPLPPMPTSPIPRKMTRNPFERYLSVHTAREGASCTLHARFAMAVANNVHKPRSVLEAMERQISRDMAQMDEEMATVGISSARPKLLSVHSGRSTGMDVEE